MITNGDDFAFGVPYVQHVLGIRPDVIELNWPTLGFDWSLERLAARGVPYDPRAPGDDVPSVRLADLLNASGHPVFVDDFASNILHMRPVYPFAGLMRVLPKGGRCPSSTRSSRTTPRRSRGSTSAIRRRAPTTGS